MSVLRARRLVAAVTVSVAAHATFVAWLEMPAAPPHAVPLPLEAQLAPPPAPSPRIEPTPEPRIVRTPRRAGPAPQPRVIAPPAAAAPSHALLPDTEAIAGEAAAADAAPEGEPPTAYSEAAPAAPPPPSEAAPSLPRRAELVYTLYLGTDKFSVGRAVFTWQAEGGAYRLVSASETTGIVDLFRAQRLIYVSEGRLTEEGLRPENFAMSRTRRGRTDAAQAHLDWAARRLTYGRPAQQRTVELPADSQDIMSFVFQLALHPPAPGRVSLPITNGTRFEIYELDVRAAERIETPLGLLEALPLKQLRKDGTESIEVWLAVDYGHLPVKVRFLDREGNPAGEQIVSEMRLSPQ